MNQTGLKFRFRSLYRQSVPGSRVNEDGAGLHERSAWIVDGATGVSDERLTPGPSDAAWLVEAMDRQLPGLVSKSPSAGAVLEKLEADLQAAFTDAAGPVEDGHAPSACLGLVSLMGPADDGRLRVGGAFLGDVVALVPSETGIVRWTDERAKPFERRTLAALGAGGHEPGIIPEAVRRQIRQNRTMLNRPDGYWVVNPRHPWAGHELRFKAMIRPGEPLVLATDGFMRLVDVFGCYTDSSLYERLAAGAGESLIDELRDLERRDPMAGVHARVKTHDDATVLVIAAEPYG